jgi:hypothetical protein
LLLWIVIPLLFFSFSQSKLPHYVLPLMPAIGLLVGLLWSGRDERACGARGGGVALAICGLVILLAPIIVGALLEVDGAVAQAIPGTARTLGIVCVIAGATAFFVSHRRDLSLFALCVPVVAIPFVSMNLMGAIGEDRSGREMARAIQRIMTDRTEIIAIQTYPLSLPFYLRRQFLISTRDGSELTSNYLIRTYSRWTGTPGSPFRPEDWWVDILANCRLPRVFLARVDDVRARSLLSNRLPLISTTRKVAAYGPCGASDLAALPSSRTLPSY